MTTRKVAVVTGGNRGIGIWCVRLLCKGFDGDVFLTCRNPASGEAALEKLRADGLNAKLHQLDTTDTKSIQDLRDFLVKEYGGLDVLINNAGVVASIGDERGRIKAVEDTMEVNFYGTLNTCEGLFPILRENARVVNVSSILGQYALDQINPVHRKRILDCPNMQALKAMIDEYVGHIRKGSLDETEWPRSSYDMSKLAVCFMTAFYQKMFDQHGPKGAKIYAVAPSFCKTDMTGGEGFFTAEEGAEVIVRCALIGEDPAAPGGSFFFRDELVDMNQPCTLWTTSVPTW